MEWIESPTTRLNGTESMDEIMQQAEDDEGIPQDEETYKKIGEKMESMLLYLSEKKLEHSS